VEGLLHRYIYNALLGELIMSDGGLSCIGLDLPYEGERREKRKKPVMEQE
jgi:hypothetical protein